MGASLVAQWQRIHLPIQETQVWSLDTLDACQPTPVFLPGKSQEQRHLAGYSPLGHKRVVYDVETEQQQ